jgi:hypothetical protein
LKTRFPLFFLAKTRFCEIPVGGTRTERNQKMGF